MSNQDLTDTERRVREQLQRGMVGPKDTAPTSPVVRRASAPPLTSDLPPGVLTRDDAVSPELQSQITNGNQQAQFQAQEPTFDDGLAKTAIATKPVLATKEKEIDDRFLSLEDLPSNFHPYPDRDRLLIRPFAITELKLVARAIETGDSDFITQAIDNCIDFPVTQLTIADYFYLYYWMRIQSYPNTPHYMEWKCDEVHEGHTCNHENVTPLTHKELKVVYLEDLSFDLTQLDPRLDFPRVALLQDLALAQESKTAIKEGRNKEATFSLDDLVLVNAAKWIKEGETLRDKIAVLERQPNLELYEVASKTNKAFEYGVYEYAMVNCGRCGAKRRYRVLLDAPRFFPFVD